jgi:2'-5' RNA ligase
MATRHRLFLALNFDDDFKRVLGNYARGLGSPLAPLGPRWVDPRLYHLTLYFFGEVDEAGMAAIVAGFAPLAERTAAPKLAIERAGFLPSTRDPRVLYLGLSIDPPSSLAAIIQAARELAAEIGAADNFSAAREARPWLAHLTLARFKTGRAWALPGKDAPSRRDQHPVGAQNLPPPPLLVFLPSSFDLMESFLSPSGPRYEIARRFDFKAATEK